MIKQGVQYRVIHHLFQVFKLSIECNETKKKIMQFYFITMSFAKSFKITNINIKHAYKKIG